MRGDRCPAGSRAVARPAHGPLRRPHADRAAPGRPPGVQTVVAVASRQERLPARPVGARRRCVDGAVQYGDHGGRARPSSAAAPAAPPDASSGAASRVLRRRSTRRCGAGGRRWRRRRSSGRCAVAGGASGKRRPAPPGARRVRPCPPRSAGHREPQSCAPRWRCSRPARAPCAHRWGVPGAGRAPVDTAGASAILARGFPA